MDQKCANRLWATDLCSCVGKILSSRARNSFEKQGYVRNYSHNSFNSLDLFTEFQTDTRFHTKYKSDSAMQKTFLCKSNTSSLVYCRLRILPVASMPNHSKNSARKGFASMVSALSFEQEPCWMSPFASFFATSNESAYNGLKRHSSPGRGFSAPN